VRRPAAEIFYVPADQVLDEAQRQEAIVPQLVIRPALIGYEAHGSGGGRSTVPLAGRTTNRCGVWSTPGP